VGGNKDYPGEAKHDIENIVTENGLFSYIYNNV
jgi:hypothetical protein